MSKKAKTKLGPTKGIISKVAKETGKTISCIRNRIIREDPDTLELVTKYQKAQNKIVRDFHDACDDKPRETK